MTSKTSSAFRLATALTLIMLPTGGFGALERNEDPAPDATTQTPTQSADDPQRPKRPVRAEDIPWFGLGALSARISPDGGRVAYVQMSGPNRYNQTDAAIWVFDRETEQYTNLARGVEPQWSPTGRWLAFLGPTPNGYQVFVADPQSRAARRLTDLPAGLTPAVHGRTLSWSRGSDRIAFTYSIAPPTDGGSPEPAGGAGGPNLHRLAVVPVTGGEITDLAESREPLSGCLWAPGGKTIFYQVARMLPPQRFTIRSYSFSDGATRDVLDSATPGLGMSLAPGSGRIGFLAPLAPSVGSRIRHPYAPAVLDLKTGGSRRILERHGVGPASWAPDGQTFFQSLSTGSGNRVFRIHAASGQIKEIRPEGNPSGTGSLAYPHLSAAGDWMVAIGEDFNHSPEVWLMGTDGSQPERLTRTSLRLRDYLLGEGETVRWKSRSGAELGGILIKPVAYYPGRRFPLIVDLPGGRAPLSRRLDAHWQFFASRGYAVFIPESVLSGTDGLDAARQAAELDPMQRVALVGEDIVRAMKTLVSRGIVAPDRVGLRASGFGAVVGEWLIAHSPFFGAAVFTEPLSLPPAPDLGRIRTPTLFIYGADHPQAAQAVRVAEKIQRTAGHSEAIVYEGASRSANHPDRIIDAARRTSEWFDLRLSATDSDAKD